MKAKLNHTPGPWKAHYFETYYEVWNETHRICLIESPANLGEDIANARLIAAAPELLLACELLIQAKTDGHIEKNPGLLAIKIMKEAIAKAYDDN